MRTVTIFIGEEVLHQSQSTQLKMGSQIARLQL